MMLLEDPEFKSKLKNFLENIDQSIYFLWIIT